MPTLQVSAAIITRQHLNNSVLPRRKKKVRVARADGRRSDVHQRVQKCDAERPHCKTCRVAGKTEECEYEEEARQSLATALLLRTRELEERLARYEAQERHMSQPPPMPTVESLELDLPQDLLQTVMSSAFAITGQ